MAALVVALAAGGYMAYQHYFDGKGEVNIQDCNPSTCWMGKKKH